ncbi:uncharacterized protein LOC141874025 isoform X2 [Acropora palmata]|uniref:uncharacterized protein LOC141874025 isoform X2 n=1 Tax=Acropora palmata TaxID=6131 RepID=UPI003DA148B6
MMMIYFGILNVISSFGDSILDISHLCLISVIAKDQMEAVELSAIRSVFSYLSDILTFAVAWVILGQDSKSQISEDSSKDFMVLTAILVAVGVLTSLIYHLGTKEPSSCPPMALRKLSTLAAGNSARLTAFIPSRVLGKQTPSLATGLDVVRKFSSRPSSKVSLVSFCDAIRRTAAKCDENEGKMLPKETYSPKENQHCSSSSLSNDPTAIGVVNKGFYLSVLDLYSDGDTSHVGNEAAPTHASAVSLENKRAPLSETEANSEPVINSGSNIDMKKSCPSKKTSRVTISDEIQLTPKKFNTRKGQTLSKKKKPPEGDLQSFSSDPYCASVVDKPRSASVLDVYSDEESKGTSQVSKEPKPIINVSDISLETKSTPLSNTKAKGSNTSEQESHPSRKKARVSFSDGIRCTTTTKSNANEEETLILNEKEPPKRDHKSWSSGGPYCTDGVNKDLSVSHTYTCQWVLEMLAFSYLPLLLIYRLRLSQESIAYLPLIMSISASVSSILSRKVVQKIGNKLCFIFAAILVSSSGVITYFMEAESSKTMIYPAVTLLGFGFSLMLVNSLSFATDLIGDNTKTSGFVFAFMSLVASVICGCLVVIIQELFPEQRGTDCEECGDYMRLVFSLGVIAFSTFGAFLVLLLYYINRFQGKSSSSTSEESEISK